MAVIQLANPWALLALGSIPIIIILHSLRPRRRQVMVSTVSLWREALVHRKRGLGLQKLLKDLSLLLLLLMAAALGLGLAEPHWITDSNEDHDIVLVLDVSASMKANASGLGSRFTQAKRQAETIINELADGGRVLLMTSGRKASLRSAFETDRDVLKRRLSDIAPTDESGRPREALTLALSLLHNRDRSRIIFLTDGAFDDNVNLGTDRVEYRRVDGPQRNVAITRFDIRPEIGMDHRFQVLITLQNYTGDALDLPVSVTLEEHRLLEETITLQAFEKRTLIRAYRGLGGGRARAFIDHDDDLSADNQAFVMVGADQPLRIALFTAPEGSFYLETVFKALPNTRLTSFDLFQEDLFPSQASEHDIVVFDGVPPPELAPGSYLLVDTVAPGLPFTTRGWISHPVIESGGASALVRNLDFTGVRIDRVRRVVRAEDSPGLQRLFWSEETDLALALLEDDRRIIYLGFDPAASSFPLHAAFPLFLSESLAWLHPRENRFSQTQLVAGRAFRLRVPGHETQVTVIDPNDNPVTYQADLGQVLVDTTPQAGFYHYRIGETQRYFAVNLTDSRESDIRVRAVFPTGQTRDTFAREPGRVAITVWPYLAGLVLLMLTLEWWLWCGRRTDA